MTEGKVKTQRRVCVSLCCMQQTVQFLKIIKRKLGVVLGVEVVSFVVWRLMMHRLFFLCCPSLFLSTSFPSPLSLRNQGMPCLWSLPICICHMQNICVQDLACNMLQFWQRRFRTYEKCPTVLAKNTTLFMNLECPLKASKCFTRKKIAHSTLFNTKTYISLQIQITQTRGKYFSQRCLFSHVAQHVLQFRLKRLLTKMHIKKKYLAQYLFEEDALKTLL